MDLRNTSVSCTSHPVIKLRSIIDSLIKEGVNEVKIFFRVEDIPEGIMKLILTKNGYIVEESKKLDDGSLMFIAKRRV